MTDKCPNEPETFNGFEDEDGCPDKGSVIIQDNNIIILDKIQFALQLSAEILPASNKILDAVSTTLSHHPEFTLLEVAGHADERGERRVQPQAHAGPRQLGHAGAHRARHRASRACGARATASTARSTEAHNEAAWEQNRRVEFKIVKTKDGPTGVELGCANARPSTA